MDSLVCYWARLAVPIASRLLHVESTESGWWYVCPGEAAITFACFLTDAVGSRQLAPSKPTQWNAPFQDTRLCHEHDLHAQAEHIQSLPVGVAGLICLHGSRWVAAGDAAIKLDPIGSSGTATALESGVLAARALLASQQGNQASAGEMACCQNSGEDERCSTQRKQRGIRLVSGPGGCVPELARGDKTAM